MQVPENTETSATVESPCVGVCAVKNRLCIGCFRTIKEIGGWSTFTPAEKREVLAEVRLRREALNETAPNTS